MLTGYADEPEQVADYAAALGVAGINLEDSTGERLIPAGVFVAKDVSLAFAHFRQNKSLVAFDLTNVSNAAGTEVSGTLGFGMLFQLDLKIDYRDGLVYFGYDPPAHR